MKTLSDCDRQRFNNLNLLRFVAATSVIFSHAYLVTNSFKLEPLNMWLGFVNFGSLAVYIFFVISGYLITKSFNFDLSVKRYISSRALRIFPALIASSILTALLLGPFVGTLTNLDYFCNPDTYKYALTNSIFPGMQSFLPGVFESNPYPLKVNSPLWTLSWEIFMYGFVFLIGLTKLALSNGKEIAKHKLLITITFIYLFLFQLTIESTTKSALQLVIFFLMGVFAYYGRKILPIGIRLMLTAWILSGLAINYEIFAYKVIVGVSIGYSVMVLAYHPKLRLVNFAKHGDFSYGLYIYSFPIQQVLALKFPNINAVTNFICAFLLALPLAILSWKLIEAPAMGLKNSRFFSGN